MVKNIVTPWSFRDGKEYIVSLAVGDNPTKNVSIHISDKITAEEWSCNHDIKYIENLTHKTGSYKPFDTFISMIKSAILKKTDSVTLDLMSADDLEAIKLKKLQSELVIRAQIGSPNGNFPTLQNQTNYGSQKVNPNGDKKRYLIVTYVAEFDRVHYPVPLIYTGLPDATIMQNNILKLQSEVAQLKSVNCHLEKKLSHNKVETTDSQRSKANIWNNKDIDNGNDPFADESLYSQAGSGDKDKDLSSRTHHNCTVSRNIIENSIEGGRKNSASSGINKVDNAYLQSTLDNVLTVVRGLEERIVVERAEHFEKMNQLQAENDSLHSKLLASLDSERELRKAMEKLELLLANKSSSSKIKEHYSHPKHCFSHNSVQTVKRNSKHNRDQKFVDQTRHCVYTRPSSLERMRVVNSGRNAPLYQRSRCSSVSSNGSVASIASNKSISSNSRTRSTSPSRRIQPFDPTAYVREKKLKQEQMAQLRMSKIESRMRSRSASRERIKTEDNYVPEYVNYTPSTCSVCDVEQKVNCAHEHNDRGHIHTHIGKNSHNNPNLFINVSKQVNSCSINKNSQSPKTVDTTKPKFPTSVGNRGDGNPVSQKISHLPVRRVTVNDSQRKIRSPEKKFTNTLWKRGDGNSLKISTKTTTNFSRSDTEEYLNRKNIRGNKQQNADPNNPFNKYLDTNNSRIAGDNTKHKLSSRNQPEVDVHSLEQRLSSLQNVIDEHQKYFTITSKR